MERSESPSLLRGAIGLTFAALAVALRARRVVDPPIGLAVSTEFEFRDEELIVDARLV